MESENFNECLRELRDVRRATVASFNALRADINALRAEMNAGFGRVDGWFGEMHTRFDELLAGQQHIVELIPRLRARR
ncbi:hypothetical protein ACAG26_02820 [Mycobacterium sp. pUA109]|uniref:hypothetical protein n=1 Tax=Mycobacterium sp. pUA109 TaxID=3238982 RepID=UPI00351B003A